MKILDLITYRGSNAFKSFVSALHETGNREVATKLATEAGMKIEAVSNVSPSSESESSFTTSTTSTTSTTTHSPTAAPTSTPPPPQSENSNETANANSKLAQPENHDNSEVSPSFDTQIKNVQVQPESSLNYEGKLLMNIFEKNNNKIWMIGKWCKWSYTEIKTKHKLNFVVIKLMIQNFDFRETLLMSIKPTLMDIYF